MRNIFLVPIEPLDNRYTKQWYEYIPNLLKHNFKNDQILVIDGNNQYYSSTIEGAFFDFAATCKYKASQAQLISEYFMNGQVNENDIFFFTDAWNPTVHTIRYISELCKIPVKCAGIWHAGYYDPTDILGFTIKNHDWISHLEKSMYYAYDMNFFGTEQHKDKFYTVSDVHSKSYVCGYPLEYLKGIQSIKSFDKKKKQVVFPHRLNSDKAPEIFDFIKNYVTNNLNRSDISFVKTQELNLDKDSYYNVLAESMVVFSANKHENLGIGTFEAMMLGAYPIVPNKLSYKEMYQEQYKYQCERDFYSNEQTWKELAEKIIKVIDTYNETIYNSIIINADEIYRKFFTSTKMIEHLKTL